MRTFYLIIALVFITFSCQKEEFEDIKSDPHNVQQRLDQGESPLQIINSGVAVEHLFGKIYQQGYIFYVNAQTGEGLVCSMVDLQDIVYQDFDMIWAENDFALAPGTQLENGLGGGLNNTATLLNQIQSTNSAVHSANAFSAGGGTWYLPTSQELEAMYNNLHRLSLIDFTRGLYWSSNMDDDQVIAIDFSNNSGAFIPQNISTVETARVRAVKQF